MKNQTRSRKTFIAATVTTTIAATILSPIGVSAAFQDVGASYKAAVQFLTSKGVQGFSSTEFGVSQPIKRIDAAVMLAKVLNLSTHDAPDSGFTDVPDRAIGYVNALKAEGVINGVSPTKFNANSYITRGEIAIMIQNAYGLPGDANHKFTDVSSTFKRAVGALYNYNVTKGISSKHFGTNQPVTRGDFANMLLRASKIDPSKIPNTGNNVNPSLFSISKVDYISKTEVEITFSKAVDSVKTSNFTIDGLKVKKAKLDSDKKRVTLTIENMEYATNYLVKVRGIKVNKNEQRDVSASFRSEPMPENLKIEDIKYISITELEVYLSRAVDKVNAKNFSIEGLVVKKATLSPDKKRVDLVVENMEYSEDYTLRARDIEIDKVVQKDVTASFRSGSMPADAEIEDVNYVSINELEVEFAKAVDSVNAKNFSINGLTIKKATLSSDKKQVTLIVENMEYDRRYTLRTSGIKMNKIVQRDDSASFRSKDMPRDLEIEDVDYISITELEVEFSKPVDSVKTENFIIEDLVIKKATLSKDKKRVTLLVEKMEYDERYRLKARGLSINKEVQREVSASFRSGDMPADVKLKDANYLSKTEVQVTFSEAIDSVKADNFIIDGLTVTKAQLSKDKKLVVLTVKDMMYNKQYTVTATGIKQNKIVQADSSVSFSSVVAPPSVEMTNIKYITRSQIEVTFSKAVDSIKAENFSIEGIEVSGAKLSKDKMSATLTLKTLEYGKQYTLKMMNVKVNGDLQSNSSKVFRSETNVGDLNFKANYISQTEIELAFNKAIDGAKENNFSIKQQSGVISGKAPNIAKVKLSKDKKTVTLTVENLGYNQTYEVQAIDLRVNKVTQAASKQTFKSKPLNEVWDVLITTKKPKVLDDKKTQTEVVFQILNKQTQKVDNKATGLVLDVSTNYGEFEVDGLTLPQLPGIKPPNTLSNYKLITKSGTAKLTLITPASEDDAKAKITARVTETPTTHSSVFGIDGELEVFIKKTIPSSSFQIANVEGRLNGSGEDAIYITFTEGVHTNEGKNDATDPSRYTVNGKKLDQKTAMVTVACGEINEENKTGGKCTKDGKVIDENDGYRTVIIILPDKTLRGDYNNLVSVDQDLLSYAYTRISGNTARAFWGVDNVSNDSLDEAGVSEGNVVVMQESKSASIGPEEGIRLVKKNKDNQGDVWIRGNDVGKDGTLHLKNLTIEGDLKITSPVKEIILADSVTVNGNMIIQNENIERIISRGNVNSLEVATTGSDPDQVDIINENQGAVSNAIKKVIVNTERKVSLTGLVEDVLINKPATLIMDGDNSKVEHVIIDTSGTVELQGNSNGYNKVTVNQPLLLKLWVIVNELEALQKVEFTKEIDKADILNGKDSSLVEEIDAKSN